MNTIYIVPYFYRPTFDKNIISGISKEHSSESYFTAETDIKYAGYVEIENRRVDKIKKLDMVSIPNEFNYKHLSGLSNESRERLSLVQPETIGQASRLAGVRPSDISVLPVYLKSH